MITEGSFDHSSVNKNTVDDHFLDREDEESGWTAYLEDFSYNGCSFDTSSMVSDAASLPATKPSFSYNHCRTAEFSSYVVPPNQMPKRLCFKKTRTKEISRLDDSLEDTASSPANSPKVSETKPTDQMKHQRETIEHFNNSLAKGGSSLEVYGGENEWRELKKRGLCLVPLSMLVNYLG